MSVSRSGRFSSTIVCQLRSRVKRWLGDGQPVAIVGAAAEAGSDARLHQPAVEQVAADGYAAGREHLDVAAGRAGDGDIERAAAEIEDEETCAGRKLRFRRVVVRRADRLFEEPDVLDAGETPRLLESPPRGLVLRRIR